MIDPLAPSTSSCVLASAEWHRIDQLPRRTWTIEEGEELSRQLSELLKTPVGTMKLLPVQAICLREFWAYGGLFAAISVSAGKALAHGELVLTPGGYKKIEDIVVGDYAIGRAGRPIAVTGVYPQGLRETWRVTFSDGNSSLCSGDHLWSFHTASGAGRWKKLQTRTTEEWARLPLRRKCGNNKAARFFLPMIEPVELPEKKLPLDPYTLGCLLGDGGLSQKVASFTSMDQDIVDRMVLPAGVEFHKTKHQNCGKATQYNLVKKTRKQGGPTPNPLQAILAELGLCGTKSDTKFVPSDYLTGSLHQRLELLRGLLDTDGYHARGASVEYCSMSKELANAVSHIVETVGGTVSTSIGQTGAYRVWMKFPAGIIPFSCRRKKESFEREAPKCLRPPARGVVSIVREGFELCTCIKVDAEDGLFATQHCLITHNTLLSLLLARMRGISNYALMIPAKLKGRAGQRGLGKTEKEIQEYSRHWNLGALPTLISDESLGPVTGKGTLESLAPKLIIIDEAHKFRNPKASRTKKLRRYLHDNPDVLVCCLSGTVSKRAFGDYAHIIDWCLKDGSPLPRRHDVVEEWDAALGEGAGLEFNRLGPGALLKWAAPGDVELLGPTNAARKGFQRRLSETPGVVCYHVRAEDIDAGITIRGINTWELPGYETGAIEQAFSKIRPGKDAQGNATGWELPDGQELVEGLEIFAHVQEEALGFFRKWKYPAPKEWLEKRKAFNTFIREHLTGSRKYDSPDEVAQAYPAAEEVVAWKKIRKSFEPETIVVWLDSGPLKLCVDWLKGGGIAFTQHNQFGEALAGLAGVPYFGAGGVDAIGRSIEDFQGSACVASVFANGEGRNLHLRKHPLNPNVRLGFSRMLVVTMLRNWLEWEQTIGRIHRLGCLAEHCYVDVLIGCSEHIRTFEKCIAEAERTRYAEGGEPKLLQAEIENIISSSEMPKGLDAFR